MVMGMGLTMSTKRIEKYYKIIRYKGTNMRQMLTLVSKVFARGKWVGTAGMVRRGWLGKWDGDG